MARCYVDEKRALFDPACLFNVANTVLLRDAVRVIVTSCYAYRRYIRRRHNEMARRLMSSRGYNAAQHINRCYHAQSGIQSAREEETRAERLRV